MIGVTESLSLTDTDETCGAEEFLSVMIGEAERVSPTGSSGAVEPDVPSAVFSMAVLLS